MTECNCPSCRGLNDERYEEVETETQEVEIEVTFIERMKLTIPLTEFEQDDLDKIQQEVEKMYLDVEVEDWRII